MRTRTVVSILDESTKRILQRMPRPTRHGFTGDNRDTMVCAEFQLTSSIGFTAECSQTSLIGRQKMLQKYFFNVKSWISPQICTRETSPGKNKALVCILFLTLFELHMIFCFLLYEVQRLILIQVVSKHRYYQGISLPN